MLRIVPYLLAMAVCAVPLTTIAEVRIGYVHTKKVVEQAPQAIEASKMLQTEFAGLESVIVADQKKLQALEARLKRDSAVMSEDARRKLEREILSKQREIKRSREEFTQDLNIRRNEEFAKLQRDAKAAIEAVAKEGNYDLILELGAVYVKPEIDLTARVIERLKSSKGK